MYLVTLGFPHGTAGIFGFAVVEGLHQAVLWGELNAPAPGAWWATPIKSDKVTARDNVRFH